MTGYASIDPPRVCFPFTGGQLGGSHISALKLIQSLDPCQITPVVVLQDSGGPLAAFLKEQGQPFVSFDAGEILLPGRRRASNVGVFFTRTLPRIRRFIREGRFEIVHTNDGRAHVNWGLAARLAGASVVWHHRGDPDAMGANWLAPLIADQMITVSRFARPRRPVRSLESRLSVIHSPFDPPSMIPDREKAKAELLAHLGAAPGTHVLSFVGNLVERKRPFLFLEILARFRHQHPQLPAVGCVFGVSPAGRIDLEPAMKARAASLGLGKAVHFMGFRSPIEPYLAATDILLVPAMGEPFGRTLIEAMFLGTPVVATRHGGNPEAIQNDHTGFLVEPENAEAFVEPIARLVTDPEIWMRISRTAAMHVRSSFSSAHHAEQVERVYDSALRQRFRTHPDAKLSERMPGEAY
jgi:glycosyltransferase involved in cell wall biosynthesis